MRRLCALLLVLALALGLVTTALADEPISMLPAVNDYAGANYADVPSDSWYAQAAQVCYETGLMMGTQKGFEAELTLTGGQLAAIAARLRQAIVGDTIIRGTPLPGETLPWYYWEVQYLQKAGVDVPDPESPATRLQFAALLAAVVPESYTPAINSVTALPDNNDAWVLRLYNAGILTGSDAYGTFNPSGTLRRHECAAMVARVVRPDLRQRFTLQTAPAPSQSYEEELMGTMAFSLNGNTVTFRQFIEWLGETVYNTDANLYYSTGQRLDLSGRTDYGVGDLNAYFIEATLDRMARQLVLELGAKQFGATPDTLAQVLTPSPSYEQLSAYAQQNDLLGAKHILIKTYDPSTGAQIRSDDAALQTAQAVLDGLNQAPTSTQFDNLLALFNEDPGMSSNPEGYLFSAGQMVSEFESAVRALEMGAYTPEPVKSVYGYHIIWRVDPALMSDIVSEYREAVLEGAIDTWLASATVTLNTVELNKLDVAARYEAYLNS